jgi:polyhydroxybutyrate depolymerase
MANRLACELSLRIAAIVSLAGAVDPAACHPRESVSVLTVHGTLDRLIRYDGGALLSASYPSANTTLDFWAKADGCQPARKPGPPLRLVCDAAEAAVTTFAGCPAGIAVEHWRLEGVRHVPNFALPAWPDGVLDFLFAHPKPPGARPTR